MDAKPPVLCDERKPRRGDGAMMLALSLFVLACLLVLVGAGMAIVIGVVAGV